MRQMFTPDEFVAEVERLDASIRDVVSPSDSLIFRSASEQSTLVCDGVDGEFPIKDAAHAQIASRLGIPKAYYDRMRSDSPELLDANVMTWFHQPVERRLIRTLEGKVRAFLSDRYQRIDHLKILHAITPILERLQGEHGARIESAALTDTHMYVKVVLPGIQDELQVGDIVQAGFVLKNSETGHGSFSLEQMLYRLVCLNGMVYGDAISRRHVGRRIDGDVFSDRTRKLDDETIISAAQDVVSAAVDETRFAAIVARMRETQSMAPSVDPVRTVEELGKAHDLTETESASVLRCFVTDAARDGLGLFGLVNAVTRASQEVEDYQRATELEALGGALLDTSDRQWLALSGIAS